MKEVGPAEQQLDPVKIGHIWLGGLPPSPASKQLGNRRPLGLYVQQLGSKSISGLQRVKRTIRINLISTQLTALLYISLT